MKLQLAIAAAAALTLGAFAAPASADITGKVNLDGKAPEMKEIDMAGVKECASQHADPVHEQTVVADDKGNLANVIVAIKKEEGKELPSETPTEPATLDQVGCMYTPHALGIMSGQEFVVKNSDPFLHNVHALSTVNPPFNFGQPNKDDGKKVESPKAAEYFRVKCDVHPWMSAYIGVFEHPFFAVTKEDGTFKIPSKGLPDGEYTMTFWHEKLASETPAEAKVTVKDGKGEVNHTFKAEAAMAAPADLKELVLASTSGDKKEGCATGGACCQTGNVARKDAPADAKKDAPAEAKKDAPTTAPTKTADAK
ncbi:MAG TPA: hypothetical protein VER17_06690 [Tepidisphaeraceae bacterium]|nr:hypothetical protein [Tepidisphaeraceae bacterium]